MFCIAGWLPGLHRKNPWPSAGASRHRCGMGHVVLWFCLVADCVDLGLCRCAAPRKQEAATMIVVLLNVYLALLFVLVKLRSSRSTCSGKSLPSSSYCCCLSGLFIPMRLGRAARKCAGGSAIGCSIVPDVAGEVIEVPVAAKYAIEGRRRAVSYRSRYLTKLKWMALEAQFKLADNCAFHR